MPFSCFEALAHSVMDLWWKGGEFLYGFGTQTDTTSRLLYQLPSCNREPNEERHIDTRHTFGVSLRCAHWSSLTKSRVRGRMQK